MHAESQPYNTIDNATVRLTPDDWIAIFKSVETLHDPMYGECVLVARVLAFLLKKRGTDINRLAIVGVRYSDGQLEHAWLAVDGEPIHPPIDFLKRKLSAWETRRNSRSR